MSWRVAVILLALGGAAGCGGSGSGAVGDSGSTADAPGSGDASIGVPELPAFNPPEKNAIVGRVVTPAGRPVEGVSVEIQGAGGTAKTNYDGFYYIADVAPASRLVVRFTHPGYMPATRPAATFDDGRSVVNAVLVPLAAAAPLDGGASGKAVFGHGTVEVGAGAVTRKDGGALAGPVSVRVTPIPIRGPAVVAAPGDFSALTEEGQPARLETFAMADYQLTDPDGNELVVKPGEKARIEMLLPVDTKLKSGDVVPAWHFDEVAGVWKEEGTGTVQPYSADPSRLAFVADVGHFSTWNCDQQMETTCVSGTVRTCDGKPASVPDLMSQGVDYDGTTTAHGRLDGTYCLAVKRGSTVTVAAAVGYPPDRLVAATTVVAGSTPSQCPGPCTIADITLPCTPEEADVDCADTYFAGCTSCVSGRVVDEDGNPQAAVLTATSGLSTFTAVTDPQGRYCAPAARGKLVTVSATGPGGRTGSTSVVTSKKGSCPDCETAPDLVLSEAASPGEADIDFSKCPDLVGGVTMEKVVANGTDPAFATLDRAFAALTLVPGEGGEPAAWSLELNMVAPGAVGWIGIPVATVTLSGEGLPSGAATWPNDSARLTGTASSSIGQMIGIGAETLRIDEEIGSATITLDSGFSKEGDRVTGSFVLVFAADCAPAGATLTVSGKLDLTLRARVGLSPSGIDTPEEVEAYKCSLFSLFMLGASLQGHTGATQVAVDGVPVVGTNPLDSASYSWDQDRLSISRFGEGTTVMVSADSPVAGENLLASGTLMLDSAPDCYFQMKDGKLRLDGFTGGGNDRWLTGSFEATFGPAEFSAGTNCGEHAVAGQFGAAVCR